MKYFSMYSGIGGFELGIERAFSNRFQPSSTRSVDDRVQPGPDGTAQWRTSTCVGYSEIDKYAISVYERNFNGHKNFGSADDIDQGQLPDFDLLVGGFPCQSFSIAGKRAGFNDTRGTQFFNIARILKHKRPGHLVLENVKGLLSHENGKTIQTILKILSDIGYRVEWQVLNSKDFGVPQNRERIYIVGHLRGKSRPKVFPLARANPKAIRQIVGGSQDERVYGTDGVAPTLTTMQGGNKQPKVIARTIRVGGGVSPHGSKQNWDSYEIKGKIRRLTPKECERLQGFPDDWTAGESDTQRYKMCGNAVTVNVVEAVMKGLMPCLD